MRVSVRLFITAIIFSSKVIHRVVRMSLSLGLCLIYLLASCNSNSNDKDSLCSSGNPGDLMLNSTTPSGLVFETFYLKLSTGILCTLLFSSITLVLKENAWKKLLALPIYGASMFANLFVNNTPINSFGNIGKFHYELPKTEWRKDLEYLKVELPKHHPNLFMYMEKDEFLSAIQHLEERLSLLDDQQITFEICRIVSMIKDGHTQIVSIPFGTPPFVNSQLYPLRVYFFADGLYVIDGGRDHKDLVGKRIDKIDKTPIKEVVERISQYAPGENSFYKMQWSFPYLLNASLLEHLKIANSVNEIQLTLSDVSGVQVSKTLKPFHSTLYLKWYEETKDLDDLSRKGKLEKNYWYKYNEATNDLYFQINQVKDQPGEKSIKEFASELTQIIKEREINKLIIDARNCNGGDNTLVHYLIDAISASEKVNKYGKLFTLIGRNTFSGGVSFVSAIERNTPVIFVGEPSGSGPNQCGDVQTFTLPHSQLRLKVSSKFHQQSHYKDNRLQITPHIRVNYDYNSWKNNIDPAILTVLSFTDQIQKRDTLKLPFYKPYLGTYNFDTEKILKISSSNSRLVFTISDYQVFSNGDLFSLGTDSFIGNNGSVKLRFTNCKDSFFQSIIINYGNAVDTLHRLPTDFQLPYQLLALARLNEVSKIYRKAISYGITLPASTEELINYYAYKFMVDKNIDRAMLLFRLNTELFPFSANAWDRLAEACLTNGLKEEAKLNYQKALSIDPDYGKAMHAKSIIEKIK